MLVPVRQEPNVELCSLQLHVEIRRVGSTTHGQSVTASMVFWPIEPQVYSVFRNIALLGWCCICQKEVSFYGFSERELTFMFPICCRPSVCRL